MGTGIVIKNEQDHIKTYIKYLPKNKRNRSKHQYFFQTKQVLKKGKDVCVAELYEISKNVLTV